MIRDPIVEEVREARRQIEAQFEGDWERLIAHYQRIQNESGRRVVRGEPKRIQKPASSPDHPAETMP